MYHEAQKIYHELSIKIAYTVLAIFGLDCASIYKISTATRRSIQEEGLDFKIERIIKWLWKESRVF